jgi:hypothetical protein
MMKHRSTSTITGAHAAIRKRPHFAPALVAGAIFREALTAPPSPIPTV